MSPRRHLAVQQLGAAAVVVLVLALAGGGRYPLWVDLAVYAAGGAMAAVAVAQLHQAAADRRKRRHPADLPEDVTRDQALTEAADWVITGRPADDFNGRTLTPAMVQREALMRSGLEVSHTDAAFALDSRLHFRGYGPDPAHRSFAWEYGDLRESDDGPTSPGRM
ncbi:hypothetical protein [Streptomyces sp. NBC_01314]|uniref:hypothetical protein n=1 Tax=Streptomyces sp. NBC_01314 TaxID=2903821 RepID=UPI0030911320|nr:hypothetical protein OG622_50285 [Streptomyces sp. NBC_01314]